MRAVAEAVAVSPGRVVQADVRAPAWAQATILALVSAGLMAACYWPLNLHWLAWFALVPWLICLPRLSTTSVWPIGTVLGLVFYRIGLHWGFAISGPLAGVFIILFAVWIGFSFRVARMLMDRFGPTAMLWAVPMAFVGQEVIRCEAFPRLRVPFLAFGYSQSGNPWIAQIASLGGVYCLTGLLALSNAAIAYGVIRRRPTAWLPAFVVAVAVLILALASQPPDFADRARIPVACVQTDTTDSSRQIELTRQALSHPTRPFLVVLPEHTITDSANERHRTIRALAQLAREHQAHICVGAHVRPEQGAECRYDNVALIIGPDGRILGQQAKSVPLPFFEDGNPSRSQEIIPTLLGKLGIYICYDGLFTDVPRRVAALGADMLLVPVMDVDRWPPQEHWQHADMAPLRSIELRRCAIRAAGSGVSQIIDATGRVQASRPQEAGPGLLFGTVYLNPHPTLFVRGGYLLAPAITAAFLIAILLLTLAERIPALQRAP